MTKNRLLNVAIILCKCIRVIYILVFIGLTAVFIHFQINPDSYKEAKYSYNPSGFHFSKTSTWKISDAGADEDVFAIDKIKKTSLYFNYFKLTAVLFFMFLSIKEFQKVIQSVHNFQTFQKNNSDSFRRIGKYILVIFVLTSYNSITFQQGGMSGLNLSFTPLLLVLLAFIMAEIFKEGSSLKEENDLTI